MRQRILLVLVTGLALLVPAVAANASSTQFTTVEAPGELTGGSPAAALDEVESLGADGIRIQLNWDQVAPDADARSKPSGFVGGDPDAYPAGAWDRFDAAVDGARERGLKVHVTLTGGAPRWATRSKRDRVSEPNASEFRQFATAAGRHFGSKVSYWSIWNEPNLGKLLAPIAKLKSATVYRALYSGGYSGLRSAGVRAPILIGELAPIGNGIRGTGTIAPLKFLRAVLCLDKNWKPVKGRRCAKLPAQGFAMHPYSQQPGPFLRHSVTDNVTIGVLDRLTRGLDKAARAGALPARLPVYVTEFGVQSFPDSILGVPLAVQSDYRSMSERIAYLNPRVKSFSQYLLRDDSGNTAGRKYGAFESGLYLDVGRKAKPALQGFRLPLVVVPARGSSTRATLWGLVRPAKKARRAGSVAIEYKDRGGWRRLGSARFGRTGYWKKTVTTNAKRQWRVKWTSPDGDRYTGPATKAWARAWAGR